MGLLRGPESSTAELDGLLGTTADGDGFESGKG